MHTQAGPPDYVQPGFRSPHLGERFDLAGPLASLRAIGWRPPVSAASSPAPILSNSPDDNSRVGGTSGSVDYYPAESGRNAWAEAKDKVILVEFWASWFVCHSFVGLLGVSLTDAGLLLGVRAASPPSLHCHFCRGRMHPSSKLCRLTTLTCLHTTLARRPSRRNRRPKRVALSGASCAASLATLGRIDNRRQRPLSKRPTKRSLGSSTRCRSRSGKILASA